MTPSELWNSLAQDLQDRQTNGLSRSLVANRPLGPTRILRDGKELLHFASNDYLALAWHPQVREEFQKIAGQIGVGSGASPLILAPQNSIFA